MATIIVSVVSKLLAGKMGFPVSMPKDRFEALRGIGYEGSYDAVRRYARD
jgi:hypothetical protein